MSPNLFERAGFWTALGGPVSAIGIGLEVQPASYASDDRQQQWNAPDPREAGKFPHESDLFRAVDYVPRCSRYAPRSRRQPRSEETGMQFTPGVSRRAPLRLSMSSS